jgi:hypothetical protein
MVRKFATERAGLKPGWVFGTFFRSNPPQNHTTSERVLTASQCRFEKRCFEVGVIILEAFSGFPRRVINLVGIVYDAWRQGDRCGQGRWHDYPAPTGLPLVRWATRNSDDRPEWPRHDPSADGVTNLTDDGVVIGPDPLRARLDLWKKVFDKGH